MLEPSRAFYAAMFGAMKAGAIAVPLFTLFGPDGVRLRVEDCKPKLLIDNAEKAPIGRASRPRVVADDASCALEHSDRSRRPRRRLAIFQYTSGTTRELPEAVKHTHRAIVTLMVAALYGTGLRPGDRFFCPSSPAWGHGLWHGTLAPLALGLTIGAYAGKFDAERLLQALQDHRFTNMSAAATHYRMMRNSRRGAEAIATSSRSSPSPASRSTARRPAFCEATFGRAGVQHVRHHRDRRDPGELSRRRRTSSSSRARSASRSRAARSRCRTPRASRARPA